MLDGSTYVHSSQANVKWHDFKSQDALNLKKYKLCYMLSRGEIKLK